MKTNFNMFLAVCVIIGLGMLGSCTKKEKTPQPDISQKLYFKGTFGDDTLNYQNGFKWYNDPTYFSGGYLIHENTTDKYFFNTYYKSWWYSGDNSSEEFLSIEIQNIQSVDKNYVFSHQEYFDYLQSAPIKSTENYSFGENSETFEVKKGVTISFTDNDGIVWKSLDYNSANGNNGHLYIFNKQNVDMNNHLLVTGYIKCFLQEENNPQNIKTLKGNFNQLMSSYFYEKGNVSEY
ncbi:hypothetical protein [uncultured Cytophaga sp.]|uniref:hypothetical protein n=1 Tax=uncultured Cytophaga sp. TaxID=160238 RepID=UPI00262C2699|nr:hypothetical protein [uncultured Cytophaga sp.]